MPPKCVGQAVDSSDVEHFNVTFTNVAQALQSLGLIAPYNHQNEFN